MRLLVCRALTEGRRTLDHLLQAGHEAILAPVLELAPLPVEIPTKDFSAVIATSAHAVAGFDADQIDRLRATPLFAVGDRTAAAARSAGFVDVRVGAGDASSLAALLIATFPRTADLLYLAGRTRTPLIEATLANEGFAPTVVETYAMLEAEPWPSDIVDRLSSRAVDGCLHYSARSASLAFAFALRHDVLPAFVALDHFCLSSDVASVVARRGAQSVFVAERPYESALISKIGDA